VLLVLAVVREPEYVMRCLLAFQTVIVMIITFAPRISAEGPVLVQPPVLILILVSVRPAKLKLVAIAALRPVIAVVSGAALVLMKVSVRQVRLSLVAIAAPRPAIAVVSGAALVLMKVSVRQVRLSLAIIAVPRPVILFANGMLLVIVRGFAFRELASVAATIKPSLATEVAIGPVVIARLVLAGLNAQALRNAMTIIPIL
jgi:hypothetical protein